MNRKQFAEEMSLIDGSFNKNRLVKIGVELSKAKLISSNGHGLGVSGFSFTDAAKFLTATIGANSVAKSSSSVILYGVAKTETGSICGIKTKYKRWTFGKALTAILKNQVAASKVFEIELVKVSGKDDYCRAEIKYRLDSGKIETAIFTPINNIEQPKCVTKSVLCGSVVEEISSILHKDIEDDWS